MKKIIIAIAVLIVFVGCSSKTTELEKSPCACIKSNQVVS